VRICWRLQTDAMQDYYFCRHLPDVFDRGALLAVVNFVLGEHPATKQPYQAEYVIGVAATYIVDVLAAQRLLLGQ
jgi:hypothetical protein